MIWVFFEDVNDGSVMELCFLEEIDEGIYEQLEIYNEKKNVYMANIVHNCHTCG